MLFFDRKSVEQASVPLKLSGRAPIGSLVDSNVAKTSNANIELNPAITSQKKTVGGNTFSSKAVPASTAMAAVVPIKVFTVDF